MTSKHDALSSIALEYADGDEQAHHSCVWPSIAALIPPGRRMEILDAGCGNGFLSGKVADLGHKVTAIDISESGISKLRMARPEIRAEVRSVHDQLTDLIPAGGFDLVLSSEVIEHLYSPRDFLLNLARILRPGGCLILTTPYHGYLKNLAISLVDGWDSHHTTQWEGGHIKFYSERTLRAMLIDAGFSAPTYINAGRIPFLWKSLVCRATRIGSVSPARIG